MTQETFEYAKYEVLSKKPSMIDENAMVEVPIGFKCPLCKRVLPPLEHRGTTECECGLLMTRCGNALECTEGH